jgi:hypothetical protein
MGRTPETVTKTFSAPVASENDYGEHFWFYLPSESCF